MLVYWKKYEKVEKEHRKRAEKEAMEQRKLDDEFREVTNYYYVLHFSLLFIVMLFYASVYIHVELSSSGVFLCKVASFRGQNQVTFSNAFIFC